MKRDLTFLGILSLIASAFVCYTIFVKTPKADKERFITSHMKLTQLFIDSLKINEEERLKLEDLASMGMEEIKSLEKSHVEYREQAKKPFAYIPPMKDEMVTLQDKMTAGASGILGKGEGYVFCQFLLQTDDFIELAHAKEIGFIESDEHSLVFEIKHISEDGALRGSRENLASVSDTRWQQIIWRYGHLFDFEAIIHPLETTTPVSP